MHPSCCSEICLLFSGSVWGRGSLGAGGGVGVVLWVFVSIPKAGSECLSHSGSQSSCSLILADTSEILCKLKVEYRGIGIPAPAVRPGLAGRISVTPGSVSQGHVCPTLICAS